MKFQLQVTNNPSGNTVLHTTWKGKEKELLLYPLSIGLYKAENGYSVRRQGYDNMLLTFTLSGSGFLEYRGIKYELLPGALFLIDCDEPHAYGTKGDKWKFYWLHFSGGGSRSIVQHILNTAGPTPFCENLQAFFDQLFIQMDQDNRKSCLHSSQLIYSILMQILLASGQGQEQPPAIRLALSYMEAHYQEPVSLEAIANAAHISKFYLIRLFKSHLGQSPYACLIDLRLRRAKILLASSSLPVSVIAEQCGFSNLSSFFHHFQQEQGCTPLQYRKIHAAP